MTSRSAVLAAWTLTALLAATPGMAASVAYFLDQSNDLPDGVNYAQVTISDSVAHPGDIEFAVQILTGAFPTPLSNFGMQAFFFNFDNSLNVAPANIVDVDPASWDIRVDRNAGGGFGKFEFEFLGDGNERTELLTFRITNVAGDSPSSYALLSEFLNPGSTQFFAAHIAGYADTVSGNTSGKFAGSTPVPLPAAAWLFAGALSLLGLRRRPRPG